MLSLVDPYAASTSRSAQQCCTQFSIQRCLQPAHACRPPLRTCVVAYRSPRMAPCPRRVPLAMRAPASRRAARTEIARLRYGRPRRTERRRRATETHFTHPWVRTGGPVVQGYHLNYVDANDRGRRRRRVAAASSPPRRSVRRR
jgi:hypothetical protein